MKTLLATVFRVKKPVNFVELNFYNAVGVAAGFDKNAKYLEELACLGFGDDEDEDATLSIITFDCSLITLLTNLVKSASVRLIIFPILILFYYKYIYLG